MKHVQPISLNPAMFRVVSAIAKATKDKTNGEAGFVKYKEQYQSLLENSSLSKRINYAFIQQFSHHVEAWQKHACFPVGAGVELTEHGSKDVVWMLVAEDELDKHENKAQQVWKSQHAGELSVPASLLRAVRVLLGEHYHRHELVYLATSRSNVNLGLDCFYTRTLLDDFIQADHANTDEPSIVFIDAKPTPELDKAAVERGQGWLRDAINLDATDIHIEPKEGGGRVRVRIDGLLEETEPFVPNSVLRQVVSWIKVQADVDITDQRRALDGKMKLARTMRGKRFEIDVRYSSIPTIHGEKVVLRLLDKSKQEERFQKGKLQGIFPAGVLGNALYQKFEQSIRFDNGIVLVTGPTGCGKTTTLNTSLRHLLDLHENRLNIVTIEDPVEYTIVGANQVQTNDLAGMTFANSLRSILRQDPDIVLVGEIRDAETASVAVQSALTGHLILTTLHTNDAVGCIERLSDFGISRFLIASTVRLFQAQRLIRLLCPTCSQELSIEEALLEVKASRLEPYYNRFIDRSFRKPKSIKSRVCENCADKGYKGRQTVMEVMPMSPQLRVAIQNNCIRDDLLDVAKNTCDYHPMLDCGINLLLDGLTGLSEVEDLIVG